MADKKPSKADLSKAGKDLQNPRTSEKRETEAAKTLQKGAKKKQRRWASCGRHDLGTSAGGCQPLPFRMPAMASGLGAMSLQITSKPCPLAVGSQFWA